MSDDDEILHSERGPSTAHRWRACKASVIASRGLPNTAGIDAAHGTVFHEYAALCVEFWLDPNGFVGERMLVQGHGWITFDQDMADYMQPGLRVLRAMMSEPGVKVIVERKVSLKRWIGDGEFGTTDVTIVDVANNRIVCWDWKYGAGVPIDPVENDQAMLYVLGSWDDIAADLFWQFAWNQAEMAGYDLNRTEFDDTFPVGIEVWVMIEQPRAPGGGGTWKTTMAHILRRGAEIRKDADATLVEGAKFNPGEKQCKFCAAAKFNACDARAKFNAALWGSDFDDLENDFQLMAPLSVYDRRVLTPTQRSQILLNKAEIIAFLNGLSEEAHYDAEKGRPVPGMKLVPGRSPHRKWKDPAKAEVLLKANLGEKAFSKSLLSPTQIEDVVKSAAYKEVYAAMVEKGEPSSILVPDYDKREALPSYADDFNEADVTTDESMI